VDVIVTRQLPRPEHVFGEHVAGHAANAEVTARIWLVEPLVDLRCMTPTAEWRRLEYVRRKKDLVVPGSAMQ
jgi:hypothetical protein